MKKKRTKKYNKYNKAMNILNGLVLRWRVEDPLNEDAGVHSFNQVTHKNKIHRLMAKQISKSFMKIKDERRMKYRVNVDCHFKDDYGTEYQRGREILIEGYLAEADKFYFDAVQQMFDESNMRHYEITEITIEVLGQGNLNTKDFTV